MRPLSWINEMYNEWLTRRRHDPARQCAILPPTEPTSSRLQMPHDNESLCRYVLLMALWSSCSLSYVPYRCILHYSGDDLMNTKGTCF